MIPPQGVREGSRSREYGGHRATSQLRHEAVTQDCQYEPAGFLHRTFMIVSTSVADTRGGPVTLTGFGGLNRPGSL